MLAGKELIACGKFIATLSVFTVLYILDLGLTYFCENVCKNSSSVYSYYSLVLGRAYFRKMYAKLIVARTHAYESQYNLDGTSIYNIIHIRYVLT